MTLKDHVQLSKHISRDATNCVGRTKTSIKSKSNRLARQARQRHSPYAGRYSGLYNGLLSRYAAPPYVKKIIK